MLRAAAAFFGCARKPSIVEDEIPLHDFSSRVSIDDAWVMMNAWSVERFFSLYRVPAARSDTSLIEACVNHFELLPAQGWEGRSVYDARFATAVARKMIACYCKMDDPLQPSALFDIIIVGAYVYASACNEWLTTRSTRSENTLQECCGLSNLYFNFVDYQTNIDIHASFVMAIILTVGYKCLIEQSLPFNGDLTNCSGVFKQAIPNNRFDRYQLNREGKIDPVMHENARKLELRDESLGKYALGYPVMELADLLDHHVDIQSFLSQMNIITSRFKSGNFASCLPYAETELIKKIESVATPRP